MLRAIHQVNCWAGLQAGFDLQVTLARRLCDPVVSSENLTENGVKVLHTNPIVQTWLWRFLHPRRDQLRLLNAATAVADQPVNEKQSLLAWINVVVDIAAQFQANPQAWPDPLKDLPQWSNFKTLMLGFYDKLDSSGVPFDALGNATSTNKTTYSQFVSDYKALHGDRICVFCEGPFIKPQVDHWVDKASYPILSISPANLLPICSDCNEAPAKGSLDTFSPGESEAFSDWFHPHHRTGVGYVDMEYHDRTLDIKAVTTDDDYQDHVENLDSILILSERWTKEYKAQYVELQKELQQYVDHKIIGANENDIQSRIAEKMIGLVDGSPHEKVRRLLYGCVQEPARLSSWAVELQP